MLTMEKLRKGIALATLLAALQAPGATEAAVSSGDGNFSAAEATPPQSMSPAPAPSQLDLLVAAATSGNVDAMNDLAVLIMLRAQGPRDIAIALDWNQKAIDGGSDKAMSNLGTMYLHGVGVPQDYVNAFHWFERAAERGNVRGMYSAGAMAETGLGTPRDLRLARVMYRKAAGAGFVPAMVKVSDDYARGPGGTADLVEAYAWLRVARDAGLSDDMEVIVLAKMDALESRLGAQRRDEARKRVSQLTALVRDRATPGADVAPPVERSVGNPEIRHVYM